MAEADSSVWCQMWVVRRDSRARPNISHRILFDPRAHGLGALISEQVCYAVWRFIEV